MVKRSLTLGSYWTQAILSGRSRYVGTAWEEEDEAIGVQVTEVKVRSWANYPFLCISFETLDFLNSSRLLNFLN